MMISGVAVMVRGIGSGKVDVDVFGARNESAQVIREII